MLSANMCYYMYSAKVGKLSICVYPQSQFLHQKVKDPTWEELIERVQLGKEVELALLFQEWLGLVLDLVVVSEWVELDLEWRGRVWSYKTHPLREWVWLTHPSTEELLHHPP